jgi:nicotinate-nucleotide pyrophosphorylase (carboxylating)
VIKSAKAPDLRFSVPLVKMLRAAFDEDLGDGDITTRWTVGPRSRGRGRLIAKAEGILCGAPVADRIWKFAGPSIHVDWKVRDGSATKPGQVLAELKGPYPALLAGERVALNFLQQLSGVATLTQRFVSAAGAAKGPDICDTRKTTPLWRELERYAVRVGGGVNHRFGLFDMVLIKENHARAAGGVGPAVRLAIEGRKSERRRVKVAAEATTAAEAEQAFEAGAELILLDNMTPAQVRRIVVRFRDRKVPLEVSGGITLKNVAAYARTGVDRISIGSLTHSAPALDLSLQLEPAP